MVCAGTKAGQQLGEACIEGIVEHDQQPMVAFAVVETPLGGLGETANLASQAGPQLADFHRDHLPGLSETVGDFMDSITGRDWLWQFSSGAVALSVVETRFGRDIAEAFELWAAMQADTDFMVRNVADHLMETAEEVEGESDSATVEVERPSKTNNSQEGECAARIEVTEDQEGAEEKDTSSSPQEESEKDGMTDEVRDGHWAVGAELEDGDREEVHATMYDSLPEGHDQELRDGLGAALLPEGHDQELREELRAAVPPGALLPEGHDQELRGEPDAAILPGASLVGEGGENQNEMDNAHDGTQMAGAAAGQAENGADADAVAGEMEEDMAAGLLPYAVPAAWRRVLNAWDDPAVGAGLGDVSEPGQESVLSNGDFEHPAAPGHGQTELENQNDYAAGAAASTSSPTRRSRTTTERVAQESGPKQTDLKGWLK